MLILLLRDSLFQRGEVAGQLRNGSLSRSFPDQARRKLPTSKPSRTQPRQSSRRQNSNGDDQEENGEEDQSRDDGDDDDFEEDRRPPKRSKTTNAPASSAPGPRQRRREYKEAVATAAASGTVVPPPSVLDFAEIKQLKAQARLNAKLNAPRLLKRRQNWSDRDSTTLIELVTSRAASWAEMEKEERHRFELPRNAQAYRDRARNMKVDFLISDAVLPRGFDLVTLSKKENDRLQKLSKNPARLEADVDEHGKPTNTEYVPVEPLEAPEEELSGREE